VVARQPGQAAVVVQPGRAPRRPLRRNLQFQVLWAGSAAASLGVAMADVAYPLAILAMTGSPAQAGLFGAVQTAGMLAAALPAGQLADRHDRRRIVILSESCRALVTAAVVAGLVSGWLGLPVLLAAAALLGVGQAVTGPARLLLVRATVPPEQLTQALSQDEVRMNGAQLAGPPLGGALYAVRALAHAVPFVCTAGSFVLALLSAVIIKVKPGQAAECGQRAGDGRTGPAGAGGGIFTGLRALWGDPSLRASMLIIMITNTVGAGLTLITVVILRDQAVPPAMIGIALAGEAAGALAGSALVRPLRVLRPGVLLMAACAIPVPLIALLALPYGPWWVAGLLFVSMLGAPSVRVLLDVLVFRRAPAAVRGRVIAAVITLIGLGVPAGSASAGLLLQFLPAPAALLTLAAALAVGLSCCAARRELWQLTWPR
jgi:predicted MFS family arabinose efflux permease